MDATTGARRCVGLCCVGLCCVGPRCVAPGIALASASKVRAQPAEVHSSKASATEWVGAGTTACPASHRRALRDTPRSTSRASSRSCSRSTLAIALGLEARSPSGAVIALRDVVLAAHAGIELRP